MATCAACGADNSEQARFCSSCGTPLGGEEREERKVVSVLFVDLVDFTSRSDTADPEEVLARLRPYHAHVKSEIESFGGTVEKFIGDAVMAVFGAPVAHGDDAERAVRAGLRALDALTELNAATPGLDLQARAAVTTGEAVVVVGSRPELGQGLATGDVVNVASRLQSAAPSGRLIVDAATFRATRAFFAYDELAPVEVKGKREPVRAWLAGPPTTASAERGVTDVPLVGREAELSVVRSAWERVVSQRRPHLLTVLGPPGIGKSRLGRETVHLVESQGARVIRGRSLPYRDGTGYGAFAQQVKAVAGIFDTDPAELASAKLAAAVERGLDGDEVAEVSTHLALLLGLAAGEGVGDRQPLFFSARRFVESLAAERPTLLVFEDIHWAGNSLLDLLESLASRVRDVPVMFLALARPELLDLRPAWGGGLVPNTTLQLEALSLADARRLGDHLLAGIGGVGIGDPHVLDRLVATAEGNPLFLEELAASVGEQLAQAASQLPTTVTSTIAARLDALPATERALLVEAAVAGRIFWRGALTPPVDGGEVALDRALDELEARDFVRREPAPRIPGERQYIFKHMLIREVAYGSLPREARRSGHERVARFLESKLGDRVEESAPLLAEHWREAGDVARAIDYLLSAAATVERGWAKGEAIALYGEALALIPPQQTDRRDTVLLRRGLAYVEVGDYPPSIADLDEALQRLTGRDRLETLLGRTRAAYWTMDPVGARRCSEEAVRLAEQLDDAELLAPALALLSHAESMEGDMQRAFEVGDRALDVWLPGSRPVERAIHLEQHALHFYWTGQYSAAERNARESYELSGEVSTVESLLRAGATLGMSLTGMGRTEEAFAQFDRVIAQARELEGIPRWTARALNMSSAALRDVADFAEARLRGAEAVELGERAGFLLAAVQATIDGIYADLAEGEVGRAERAWPDAWDRAQAAQGWHHWLMSERLAAAQVLICASAGRDDDAVRAAEEALALCGQRGRLKYDVLTRTTLADVLLRRGDTDAALHAAEEAASGAHRLGHPPAVWQANAVLARCREAAGADGTEHRRRAAAALGTFRAALSDANAARLVDSPLVRGVDLEESLPH